MVPNILSTALEYATTVASRMDRCAETLVYPQWVLGLVMANDEHGMFCSFMKMKPPVFQGTEFEDALEFLIDCHDHLHKMSIIEKFGVEFVFFNYRIRQTNSGGHFWSVGMPYLHLLGLNF